MITKFYNGYVLTPEFTLSEESVFVQDDKICFIGETNILVDSYYDLSGNLLMPGFINCHAHSAMTLFRSYADDTLQDLLLKKIFPLEKT